MQAQPAPVAGPVRVSPGGSIVSVTVTAPDVGPAPTLLTVIVYVLGCPGESVGECVLPIARSGTSTFVTAGAVATVLGTPVVAAWKANSAVFSIVAPNASPDVATVTWKLTVALAFGASVPPVAGRRAGAEAHHHADRRRTRRDRRRRRR